MSDFQVTRLQRRRLLAQDYSPLDFAVPGEVPPTVLPYGCKVGAVYVLAWTSGPAAWEAGYGIRSPKVPIWYLTVTAVRRHRKGFWRVQHDVTDLRDRDVFLRPGGGDSSVDLLDAGAKPPGWWLDVRAKTIGEFEHARRLARHAEVRRERSRARRKRAA